MHVTNHHFFVDDLKLLALDDDTLARMTEETKRFYDVVGLEINREKSATNSGACADIAVLLEGAQAYKYLGLTEDSRSIPTRETWLKVKTEIRDRVTRLCQTRLNAKHLVKAINEHAISLINYYVGLLRLEPSDYAEVDFEVRQVLSAYGVHKQPACLERLYLPRTELGRGIHSVQFKSEHMLMQLNAYLTERAPTVCLKKNA
ncbi:hypothetical protein PAPHI01_2688 [Pancytospora philotis]|nr:hypothetical protein PAPHI01_2688 [Pancytospora philotis]